MKTINKYSVGKPWKYYVQGFSMLELCIVLMIAAIMASIGIATFRSAEKNKTNYIAEVQVMVADIALRQFIKKNNRLPCPDNDKDNLEDLNNDTKICKSANQVGFLPYTTLGMTDEIMIDHDKNRMIYGVYRGSNVEEDLTSSQDLNIGIFMHKLRKMYKQKGSTNNPFRPNIDKLGLKEICLETLGPNPAYILYAKLEGKNKTPMSNYEYCFYTDQKQFSGVVRYVYAADIIGTFISEKP
jgi:prepilin-type N-terminal cleavage/methylation domain-containing protein